MARCTYSVQYYCRQSKATKNGLAPIEASLISNQKGNAYLKEIQTICGIKKTLHFHLFRKTYGTRLLNRGVRLETVSKCLGHSSTQITQTSYAKLLKQTIIDEVKSII